MNLAANHAAAEAAWHGGSYVGGVVGPWRFGPAVVKRSLGAVPGRGGSSLSRALLLGRSPGGWRSVDRPTAPKNGVCGRERPHMGVAEDGEGPDREDRYEGKSFSFVYRSRPSVRLDALRERCR